MTDTSCLCLIGLGSSLGRLSYRMFCQIDSMATALLSAAELISQQTQLSSYCMATSHLSKSLSDTCHVIQHDSAGSQVQCMCHEREIPIVLKTNCKPKSRIIRLKTLYMMPTIYVVIFFLSQSFMQMYMEKIRVKVVLVSASHLILSLNMNAENI